MSYMQSRVQMILGEFIFSVDSFEYAAIKRSLSWRWASKERINRVAARQFKGSNAQTITLSGELHSEIHDISLLDDLSEQGDLGDPVPMLGMARNTFEADFLGMWCMESLDVDGNELLGDGTATITTFTLTLSGYGDDDAL